MAQRLYAGKVVDIWQEQVCLPNGAQGAYEIARHPGGAAALPVNANGELVLIRQYRPAVDAMVWEVPAGKREADEDARNCIARELQEEVGYKAGSLRWLTAMYAAIGFCDERLDLYLAQDLTRVPQQLEPLEYIEVVVMSWERAWKLLQEGAILDAKTQLALLWYQQLFVCQE